MYACMNKSWNLLSGRAELQIVIVIVRLYDPIIVYASENSDREIDGIFSVLMCATVILAVDLCK
jgi:hypothetical protein